MQADTQTAQDSGVAKIRALLLAARPGLAADARELAAEFKQKHAPGEPIPNRSSAITVLIEKMKTLREAVEAVAVEGAAPVSARDLTVRALLEIEQSLGKLAESYAAPDQASSTSLLAESTRLLKEARTTSTKAGKALGIPWPLQ